MKRLILLIFILVPLFVSAQIPLIEQLGSVASKQKGVEHQSVGSVLLGMAATFAPKEQRETYKMLEHVTMIECRNKEYTSTLKQQALSATNRIGAQYLTTMADGRGSNDAYIVKQGDIVKHLIIITHGVNGGLAVIAMSGEIPFERLGEISKLQPPGAAKKPKL